MKKKRRVGPKPRATQKHEHYWEVGKVDVDDNGNVDIEYVCTRCGYAFIEENVRYPE